MEQFYLAESEKDLVCCWPGFNSEDLDVLIPLYVANPILNVWPHPAAMVRELPLPDEATLEDKDFLFLQGFLVLGERAHDLFKEFLSDDAEFLPVKSNSSRKFLLHVLTHVDLGPKAKTNQTKNYRNITVIRRYDFDDSQIRDSRIFGIRQPHGCWQGDAGHSIAGINVVSQSFCDMVHEHDLTGLKSEPVFPSPDI